jgi:glucose/mannose-6-phosphate isomerase
VIDLDDERALAAGDPGGMLATVSDLSGHCREGYALGTTADGLPSADGVTAVAFCGMGGSAVAGDVLRELFRDRLGVPIDVTRSPALPEFCGPHTLVVCSSYSGDTAETLACFEEAIRRGCRIVPVASGGRLAVRADEAGLTVVSVPGGFMPRAALGYLAFAAMGALESVGLFPPMSDDVADTVAELERLAARLAPTVPRADNPAKELAWQLGDRVPLVWGAEGIGAVAAARWKTQLNENAKVPAWSSALPELDHNEVVGWTHPAGTAYFLVALRHDGEHPDVAARFPLSIRIAQEAGAAVEEVRGAGGSPLARLMSLITMGDFTSVYHALAHGVDPTPVAAIERLKTALAEASR